MQKNNFAYKNVVNELNNLFNDLDNTIKYDVENALNIKVRNRDTSFSDALLYKFRYSIPDTTKQEIVSEMNITDNKTTSKYSYDYRENQIPISSYKIMFSKVSNLYKKLMSINDNEFKEIAVDGVFNNTNILNEKGNLETTLNLGYYDNTNDIPIDLTFEGSKTKKHELEVLKSYLNDNKINNNCVLILDRLYCCYDFVNYLMNNGYKFVIRFRNNCVNFNKIKKINNIRILNFFEEQTTTITHEKYDGYINPKKNKKDKKSKVNKKDKKAKVNKKSLKDTDNLLNVKDNQNNVKSYDVNMKYEYTLVTNLTHDTHADEEIKNLYKDRWYVQHSWQPCTLCVARNVEIFFKLLKHNFKFEHLNEHDKQQSNDAYVKLYLVNLIIVYLAKIIEKTYFYNNYVNTEVTKIKNGIKHNYKNKANKSLSISGVYKILKNLFNNDLTVNKYINICNNYVKYSLRELGLSKERKAKTPFLKWYVKGHSNRSLLCKIIEAMLTGDLSKLNDNHKVLFNICTVKINRNLS
jgi:Tfp pilus assembly protein PilW